MNTAPRGLDAERARRVSQEMAGSSTSPDRAGPGPSRHRWVRFAPVAAPCLLAAAMAAALAHGPRQGRAHFRPEESGDSVAQEMAPDGSLRGMNTRSTSIVPVAAAAAIASNLLAVPPGYVLVADSQAQFSGVQGQDGWWYLFDRGEGTAINPMPYLTPYNGAPDTGTLVWCPEPVAGFGGSFCMIWPAMSHTNQSYTCDTPLAGLQRPIRRWSLNRASPLHVTVQADLGATFTSALRADLLADATTVGSWLTQYGSTPTINASIDLESASKIDFRLDPVDGCAADGCNNQIIRIYAPDCDANGIGDILQIDANPAIDANADGRIDACQCAIDPTLPICCPADLNRDGQVNGADIGAVLAFWGPNPAFPAADIDRSGAVDGLDLAMLLAAWGPCGP